MDKENPVKIKETVSDEWRDKKYQETFDEELRGLNRRLKIEPSCKIEEFEGILQNLYILDGADQGGRGCLQDIIIAAKIAAFEHFIAQLKANK